jgi:nicotinamidase-related amidase
MTSSELLQPAECVFVFVDFQAGLASGVESTGRQTLINNAVALARTALAFRSPVVATTSASKVYSGPLLPEYSAFRKGSRFALRVAG